MKLKLFLGLVLTVSGIWLLVRYVDLAKVWHELTHADAGLLALASLALVAGMAAFATRWQAILGAEVRWRTVFHASNVGHAGNILVPGRAGEPARIVLVSSASDLGGGEVTSSFVVERMFELLMRVVALLLAAALGFEASSRTIGVSVATIVVFVALVMWAVVKRRTVLRRLPRVLAKLPKVSETGARKAVRGLLSNLVGVSRPARFAAVLWWSLVTWGLFALFHYLCALALADPFEGRDLMAVALASLALAPPSAATQPGLFHVSVIAPLAAAGFPADRLTAFAVVVHALEMVWMTLFGALGLWLSGYSLSSLRQVDRSDTMDASSTHSSGG